MQVSCSLLRNFEVGFCSDVCSGFSLEGSRRLDGRTIEEVQNDLRKVVEVQSLHRYHYQSEPVAADTQVFWNCKLVTK